MTSSIDSVKSKLKFVTAGRQTIGGHLLWGSEAGTSPFMGTHRTHVIWTKLQLVPTESIKESNYVVARTVCKSSIHDATLKIEASLSLRHNERIQTLNILVLKPFQFRKKKKTSSI